MYWNDSSHFHRVRQISTMRQMLSLSCRLTGQRSGQVNAVFPDASMDQVSGVEADHKSLLFSLVEQLIVQLSFVAAAVYRIDALIAYVETHGVDHFEELMVPTEKVLRFLRVRLQVEGDDLLMLDVCGDSPLHNQYPLPIFRLRAIRQLAARGTASLAQSKNCFVFHNFVAEITEH
jgi:hypothetical protein